MAGLHDAPKRPVSARAKTGWGSAIIAIAAGIYSLITSSPPILHPSPPAPRPRESQTTGSIPRIASSAPPPWALLIPPKSTTFAKASPSGSSPPARTQLPAPRPSARTSTSPAAPPATAAPRPVKSVVGTLTNTVKRAAVVTFLRLQVGKPYVYGGNGPLAYDCSGLLVAAFKQVGIQLPRTSAQQAGVGAPVSLRDLLPGDILFWGSPATHSAVFVGDGKFIGAENQALGVAIEPIAWDPPSYARRVL